jgi:hypothetical protein
MSQQNKGYVFGGILLGAAGLVWALWGKQSNVTYAAVEGISVFAVIYLIAQSSERVTELVVSALSLLPNAPEEKKNDALKALRTADSTLNGNPAEADLSVVADKAADKTAAKEDADVARKDIAFLAGGLAVLLCAIGVNALNFGLVGHIGATGVNGDLDRLLTTLAAAGGTKTLHELIGRFQKSKEAAEE